MRKLFTSESVTEGHPDKVCDQVSDAIIDAILAQDPDAHIACETAAKTGFVMVFGEISSTADVDYEAIVRKTVCEIGYDCEEACFDGNTCEVMVRIEEQSPDIAMGVDEALECKESGDTSDELSLIGAGDQGMMFGYACRETDCLMPMPIELSHQLAKQLAKVRKDGIIDYLEPDGKTQVTCEYEDGRLVRIDTVLISTQHKAEASLEQIRKDMIEEVIKPIIPEEYIDENTKYFVNPTGRFVIGGPMGDSGLTGRKIIVDTYGGRSSHGGGAFSGKDPTKVDRSAAYMARYIAKNIVAAGIAERCEIELAYAIGVAKPVSVYADTFGSGVIDDEKIVELVKEHFDMRPAAIIKQLDLRKPIYRKLASYGHFGSNAEGCRWEDTDRAEELRRAAGLE
ncbi:MAG: methionine adenosyltransferase [Firmicutes bacterium]|nr:methionine adenosyltransferase [Bacillota bacterium]